VRAGHFAGVCAIYLMAVSPSFSQLSQEQEKELDGIDAYRQCVFPKAVDFAKRSSEPADVIRAAVMAACFRERDAAIAALKNFGIGENEVRDLDRHVEEQILLAVVSTRSKQ
jgi:hypothetical protein